MAEQNLQKIRHTDQLIFDEDQNLVGIKNPKGHGEDFLPVRLSTDGTSLVSGDGTTFPLGGRVGATVTASGTLPASALGAVTPYNSSSSGTLTLPDAATAWATQPYGLVVVSQKGTGVPSFSAGGSDTLRATSGVAACVQYGMCAAQIISATEWALA